MPLVGGSAWAVNEDGPRTGNNGFEEGKVVA